MGEPQDPALTRALALTPADVPAGLCLRTGTDGRCAERITNPERFLAPLHADAEAATPFSLDSALRNARLLVQALDRDRADFPLFQ